MFKENNFLSKYNNQEVADDADITQEKNEKNPTKWGKSYYLLKKNASPRNR
ncbi:hypothetical protein FJ208_00030 [Candidatus Gribaldobacteria bacterium]|nr:hypothetical protein [Candidatus Gribaldobacteria bacterium]